MPDKSGKGAAGGIIPGLVPLLSAFLLWYLASWSGILPPLLPSPSEVITILSDPFGDRLAAGSLAWNFFVSLIRVLSGFLLAASAAVPAGLLMGMSRRFEKFTSLSVELARPLSPIALIPLTLVLFRSRTLVDVLGLESLRYQHHLFHEIQIGMLIVIMWGGFFPILLAASGGARSVRRTHLEAARLLGAGRSFVFSRIVIPSALPEILTGLRLGMGRCWMVIIAAEMMPGTNAGLGYLVRYSYEVQRTDIMFAGLAVIGLVGAILSASLDRLGERSFLLRREEH